MHTLAFDGRMGAAGDMICAALVAAGADPSVLSPVEEALPVAYSVGETTKNGIRATTVDVLLTEADSGDGHESGDHDHDGHSGHAHSHDDHSHDDHSHDDHSHEHANHDHSKGHDGHGNHQHAEGAGVHRSYPEVVETVKSMSLPNDVEANALTTFKLLGEAEAAVHGTDLAETHFHEVGADDAIADVVGACLLLANLDVERVVTTPLATGGGDVRMSHGVYPVPTPAVVEIAERSDIALKGGPVESELLTPTGAAILGSLAEGVETLPTLTVNAAGYGAGRKSFPEHPNVLRAIVGEPATDGGTVEDEGHGYGGKGQHQLVHDDIAVLETNLDDAAPEVLGGLQETLADAGARDVTIVPTTMKKSRPGHLVKVICKPGDAEAVAERLARETGTLGVRQTGASHRWIAERAFETATLSIGGETYEVPVKVASTTDGEVYDRSAEYDDAAAVARETGVSIRDILRLAENAVPRQAEDADRSGAGNADQGDAEDADPGDAEDVDPE